MKNLISWTLAALALSIASPATAQQPPHHEASPTLGTSLDDRILADGSPEEAARHASLTPGGQLWQQGRQQTEISRGQWRRAGRPEAEFDRIRGMNMQMCVNTSVRMLRYARLARTFQALTGLDTPLLRRYIAMEGKIRTGTGVRQVTGALQIGGGVLAGGPLYGGTVVGPGVINNEVQGQIHDEAMLLNRDHGTYNLTATAGVIEAALLNAEGNIDYWQFIYDGYCRDELRRSAGQSP